MADKLLYSGEEARAMLGVGEKKFRTLGVPARILGKRKMYCLDDLRQFINKLEKTEPCQSLKGPGRRSTGTISQWEGLDFEEARKQRIKERQKMSKQNSGKMLSLIVTSKENHA